MAKPSAEERFWKLVDKCPDADGCWHWADLADEMAPRLQDAQAERDSLRAEVDAEREKAKRFAYDLECIVGTLINLPAKDQMAKWLNETADEVAAVCTALREGLSHPDDDWDEQERRADQLQADLNALIEAIERRIRFHHGMKDEEISDAEAQVHVAELNHLLALPALKQAQETLEGGTDG